MISKLLGLDDAGQITYFDWSLLHPWLAAALIAVAVAYVVVLYRREKALSHPRRALLGAFRAAALAIIILLIFQPVLAVEMVVRLPRTLLVLLDTSTSMNERDHRRSEAELREAAMALGKVPYPKAGDPNAPPVLSEKVRAESAGASRLELAKGILDSPHLDLIGRLSQNYSLRYFQFGQDLRPTSGKGEVLPDSLRDAKAGDNTTRLGSAVEEAVLRYAGQPIAGLIVLTDGASNAGRDPLDVARRMQQRGIPLYAVGLGLADPLDVQIRSVIVQDTVFCKDEVPVRIQLDSSGYRNRSVSLSVAMDGKKVAGKVVVLTGQPQFEELTFLPDRAGGTAKLEVSVQPLPGEATTANNSLTRTIRIIDEKIKVLYVEGKPRWEYRYLRRVLLRDHRLDVKFLLTQGDRDLAEATDEHLADFPEEAAKAFAFDLIIVGDVPASYFAHSQLARMEELVKDHGGSFLMIAGQEHTPGSYVGTPVASVLPVGVQSEKWQDVDDSVHPVVTEAGYRSTVMPVTAGPAKNQEIWSKVKPLYRAPVLDGRKPAATILAELSQPGRGGEPYPLIAWQRYGSGKSMFVGSDQLWRLRFKVGDKYHSRFWGQAIQFLTLSRLLGENKRVRMETDRKEYRQGERIEISANVLNENYEPVKKDAYTISVDLLGPAKETTQVGLEPVPGIDGLYQGYFIPRRAGQYVLRPEPADAEQANRVELLVQPATLEQLEPAMQERLLRKMAGDSGGRYFAAGELPALIETIQGEHRLVQIRRDRQLWDLPVIFGLVLALLAFEWFVRRRHDLI